MATKKTVKTNAAGAKFIELAQARVPRAIHAIRTVGKLATRKGTYTDEQVAKIRAALEGAVEATMERFETGAPEKAEFEL
jgi:mRNA-degrading endonuclease toxin of MazEF toxin-antitoxin module